MRNRYQSKARKSRKFEVVGGRELLLQVPMPLVEVWEELPARVEQLAGEAGLKILQGILEGEVTQRVGPPHRPDPASGARRWGRQRAAPKRSMVLQTLHRLADTSVQKHLSAGFLSPNDGYGYW